MKITIITTTFNSAATLAGCMDSVLGQEYPKLEYVVVDGGSTDGTVELIEQYAARYPAIRWVSEADRGIYDAFNKGVAMARGEVLGFVHSDDFLSNPGILSEIMRLFETEQADGVYGDLHYVGAGNTGRVVRRWKSRAYRPGLLKQGWMPAHPTFFLKKEVYRKHGCFNLEYRIAADYDFMLRVLKDPALNFSYLPQVVTKMRVGGNSSSLKNLLKKSREDYRAIRANGLPFPWLVLLAKNLQKLPQFLT